MPAQYSLALILALAICASCSMAAIVPLKNPAMAVKVEAGKYVIREHEVSVAETTELPVAPCDRVVTKSEEHVLTNDHPQAFFRGTTLNNTLGPVDRYTRLPYAIIPETVEIHSEPDGGTVYEEGKDYFLDHDWGGLCRIEGGRIGDTQKVYVDYDVYLQRIDTIQVDGNGVVSIKKGTPAPVNVIEPDVDMRHARLANIYIPYHTTSITERNIYPLPEKKLSWRDFIKVSGEGNLQNTLSLLRSKKPVTVVCWGDSVTEGGSPSSHDRCYVEAFRARLKAEYPETPITLINAGIGGSNTNSRRDGYDKEVLALNPDLITVEFVNDAGMPADVIHKNYAEFIERARAKNPKVEFIILTPHSILPEWMGGFAITMPALRDAAKDNKVALGDTNNIWANLRSLGLPYETLNANAINHPNDLGHEFFVETLMALLKDK